MANKLKDHPLVKALEGANTYPHSVVTLNWSGQSENEVKNILDAAMLSLCTPVTGGACSTCGGSGKCGNPDHGFIEAVGGEIGRIGCPCCGHSGKCSDCNGTGFDAPPSSAVKEGV